MKWEVPTSMLSTVEIARIDLKWLGTSDSGLRVKWEVPTSMLSTLEVARIDLKRLGT